MMTVCVLSAIAGFINATLLTDLVYPVSHISGSLTHIGVDGVTGNLRELEQLVVILLGFFFGAVVGGAIIGDSDIETGIRYGAALIVEAGLLGAAPLLSSGKHQLSAVILSSMACGLQNAMFSNYRGLVLRTTHFTGTLTDLGAMIGRSSHRPADMWIASILILSIISFVGGATFGTVYTESMGLGALWLPAAVCLIMGLGYSTYHHRRGPVLVGNDPA